MEDSEISPLFEELRVLQLLRCTTERARHLKLAQLCFSPASRKVHMYRQIQNSTGAEGINSEPQSTSPVFLFCFGRFAHGDGQRPLQ